MSGPSSGVAPKQDAWIITIGDELLRGEIIDSNKAFLSERLLTLDLESARQVTVADEPQAIEEVLHEAARRARVVLVSGGLGPTRDDITTEVAARTFGRKIVRDEEVLAGIRSFFAAFGREMAENNAKQADFPEGAEPLPNPRGTAPGFMLEVQGVLLFFTPGVPRELERMMDHEILPRIARRLGAAQVVRAILLRTFGLGESNLDRELGNLGWGDPAVSIGFRTQFPDNLIRIVARGQEEAEVERKLQLLVQGVRARLGDLVVTEGEASLEQVVARLLCERGVTLALAESCTGGRIASRLTDVPGSSAFLLESVVTYSDAAKQQQLAVSPADLAAHGAVSEEVALQMARGARERTGADLGLATTGIAGPDGGTDEKPVGTVFVALASAAGASAQRYQLMRERARNKELASQIALDWVRRHLLGLEPGDRAALRIGLRTRRPLDR